MFEEIIQLGHYERSLLIFWAMELQHVLSLMEVERGE